MGYDDGECIVCYCHGFGNNHCDSRILCLCCIGLVIRGLDLWGRSQSVIRDKLSQLDHDKCHSCGMRAYTAEISVCDMHFRDIFDKGPPVTTSSGKISAEDSSEST